MKKNGFTLIELMIVMTIIGILAAITLPAWEEHVDRQNGVVVEYQSETYQEVEHKNATFTRD